MENERISTVAPLQMQFPKKETSFKNTHHLTSECLLVLCQSRRRLEVKSSGLAKRVRWFWQCFALFAEDREESGSIGGVSARPLVLVRHVLSLSPRVKISSATRTYGSSPRPAASFMMRLHSNSQDALSLQLSGTISSDSAFRGRTTVWHVVFFTVMACHSWSSTADGLSFYRNCFNSAFRSGKESGHLFVKMCANFVFWE